MKQYEKGCNSSPGGGRVMKSMRKNASFALGLLVSVTLVPICAQAQPHCTPFKERYISGSVEVVMKGEPESKRAQWTQRYYDSFEYSLNHFKAMPDAAAVLKRNIETSEMMTKDPDAGPLLINPHALNLAKLQGILCLLDSQVDSASSRVLSHDPKTVGRGAKGGT
ncbi:MAG: hypothetical protein IPK34_11330 [Ramlibacter sp.]|nr:hypothetical protein [Ramlibacter sp.]